MLPEHARAPSVEELATACGMNRWECTRYLAKHAKGYARETEEYSAVFSDIKARWFNGVFFLKTPIADAARRIHELLAEFRDLGLQGMFWLDSTGDHAALGRELLMQGCASDGLLHDMAVDLYKFRAQSHPGFQLIKAQSPAQFDLWTEIVCKAFGLPDEAAFRFRDALLAKDAAPQPHMDMYILMHDGVAVATGALFLCSGVAGTYFLAVREGHRHSGYGKILRRELQREIVERKVRYQVGSCESALTEYYAGARRIDLGRTELFTFG